MDPRHVTAGARLGPIAAREVGVVRLRPTNLYYGPAKGSWAVVPFNMPAPLEPNGNDPAQHRPGRPGTPSGQHVGRPVNAKIGV